MNSWYWLTGGMSVGELLVVGFVIVAAALVVYVVVKGMEKGT